MPELDLKEFFTQFQDYLAPKLDTYEQAIYLYVFRLSRLEGRDEIVVGFKSARKRIACGIGEKGKPMSEGSVYLKVQSLVNKGCLEVLDVERAGRRMRLKLPNEIAGVIPLPIASLSVDLDSMDFFSGSENRRFILDREGYRCFYCLRKIDRNNYVMEHVVSRPEGDNGYRNVVAACRDCNNRKGNTPVEDFLRALSRESRLSAAEFNDRITHLSRLRAGDLRPIIAPSPLNLSTD